MHLDLSAAACEYLTRLAAAARFPQGVCARLLYDAGVIQLALDIRGSGDTEVVPNVVASPEVMERLSGKTLVLVSSLDGETLACR
jgi:hypothetical protein